MKTSKLIQILQWPKTEKKYYLNPWYVILYRLCISPFWILFGFAFYLSLLIMTLDFYKPEEFRKEWLNLF